MAAPVYLDIKDVAATHVSRSTVGLLDRSGDTVTSLGTSTFIRFGDVAGLLTCAHVVHAIEKRASQGLRHVRVVMFPARENAIQNTLFEVRSLNMVR